MLQRPLHTVALAALLAAFANAAFAAPQVLSACQPATSNPTSKSLLAAAVHVDRWRYFRRVVAGEGGVFIPCWCCWATSPACC